MITRLGDVATYINGYAFKPSDWSNEGKPIIRIQDLTDNSYQMNRFNGRIPEKYYVKKGDVLISWSASLGVYRWTGEDAVLNQHIFKVVFDKTEVDKEFFIIQAEKILKDAQTQTHGATMKHLTKPMFDSLRFYYPPLAEQREIVMKMGAVRRSIEKRKAQLKKLDDLVKSQFIEMFGNPQTNEKGYPLLTVDDVIEFQGGSQPDKSYFEYTKTDNNVRLIQIRDYKTDKFVTYIPKNMVKRYCYADDIMIGRYGPPIFQILQGIEGSYNVALMKAIPKKGNKEFIRQFLKQDCLLHYLEGLSKRTAGQDGIQMDKLKQYPFPYPPIELQEQFAHFAEQTDKSKVLLTMKLFFHLYTAICLKAFEKSSQMMYNHR